MMTMSNKTRNRTQTQGVEVLVQDRENRLQCPEAALKQHYLDHKSPIIIMKVVMLTTKDG